MTVGRLGGQGAEVYGVACAVIEARHRSRIGAGTAARCGQARTLFSVADSGPSNDGQLDPAVRGPSGTVGADPKVLAVAAQVGQEAGLRELALR